jgi:hypothetical protein
MRGKDIAIIFNCTRKSICETKRMEYRSKAYLFEQIHAEIPKEQQQQQQQKEKKTRAPPPPPPPSPTPTCLGIVACNVWTQREKCGYLIVRGRGGEGRGGVVGFRKKDKARIYIYQRAKPCADPSLLSASRRSQWSNFLENEGYIQHHFSTSFSEWGSRVRVVVMVRVRARVRGR